MKKLIYILLFLTSYSFSQETVGVIKMTDFVDYTGSIKTSVKIFRLTPLATTLDVTYTVTGLGADNVDISSGTATIPAYSQVVYLEITATSNPVSNETVIITVTDVSNPDYDLGTRASVSIIVSSSTPTPAFTSAEGAAKYIGSEVSTNTWRGGGVHFVTNLNTSGAGSFSDALFQANSAGGGYIIFRVDGEIPVTTRITAAYSGIYIAGQTAPGDGILISGYASPNGVATFNSSDNILLRYINFVHGNRLTGGAIDAVGFYNAQNAYINHSSIFRGDDELVSAAVTNTSVNTTGITMDWNIFGEAYYDPVATTNSLNHNTATIMGGLNGNNGQNRIFAGTFSWNKNLTYNVSHRFPNASGYGHFESVNNLIANHNYRIIQAGYPQPRINWVNNYIQAGNETNNLADQPFSESQYFIAGNKLSRITATEDDKQMALLYMSGNILEDSDGDILISATDDSWWFNTYFFDIAYLHQPFPRTNELVSAVDIYGSTNIMTAVDARTSLLSAGGVGASKRLESDGTVTNRQNAWYQGRIDNVANRTIPNHIDVDDWAADRPTWSSGSTPYTDTDNDGMGDAWETATFGDLTKTANGQDLHPVYENIEVFLNLVDEATENPIPNVDAGQDIILCDDGSTTSTTLTASGAVTYVWDIGENTASITVTPSTTTTYTVTGTHDDGSTTTDNVTVFVNPIPNVDAGADVTINVGESTTLTATGADTYVWNNDETTASITVNPTVDTIYSVTGTTNSCESTDSVTVFSVASSAVANAGEDTAICEGETTTLTASGGTDYLWNTGETTASITVNPAATTNYTVIVSNSTSSDTDDVTVFVNPVPSVQVSDDTIILRGTYITLSATGANTYEWSNGATEPNIAVGPNSTTTYQVTGYVNDCSDVNQVTVEVLDPVTADAGEDFTVCGGDEVTLTASGGDSYIWNTGENTQSITVSPLEDTTYTVLVSNALDSDADEATVFVDECIDESGNQDDFQFIVFPNPTNNGILNIKLFGLKNLSSLYIHDIIGKLVLRENLDDNNGQTILKQIDISSFSKGMYFITLFELDRTTTKKVIFN